MERFIPGIWYLCRRGSPWSRIIWFTFRFLSSHLCSFLSRNRKFYQEIENSMVFLENEICG